MFDTNVGIPGYLEELTKLPDSAGIHEIILHLSTASNELGNRLCGTSEPGDKLLPASWMDTVAARTKLREHREVAGPASS